MARHPTQRRPSVVKREGTVGRCCQRHGITGRVITDWYPTIIIEEHLHNRCCQIAVHSSIREPVHRQTRRRTGSRASDNIPVQSAQPCAGSVRLRSHYNCNFRLVINSEYSAQHPENWGPGPRKEDGEIGERVWRFDGGNRNPFDRRGAVSEKTCLFRPAAAQPRGGASA